MATRTSRLPGIYPSTLAESPVEVMLRELDNKPFSCTAYDTAWVARVMDPQDKSTPSYPQALDWLRIYQHADGSWGSDMPYLHDRILSTLSAIVALAEAGNHPNDRNRIMRGEHYLWQNIDALCHEAQDTVGFELLLPVLLEDAYRLNLDIPYAKCEPYQRLRNLKLSMIPEQLLYSRKVTSTHSLEFMGSSLKLDCLENLQEDNGSFGFSPAATAYVLKHTAQNESARQYLDEALKQGGGAAMAAHPVEVFNKSWVLYNLDLAGLLGAYPELLNKHLEDLWYSWNARHGVGFTRDFMVPDLDDTAVVYKLLRQGGFNVHPDVFLYYEKENHFTCYSFERNPSTGANIHLLDALGACPEYEHQPRMVQKVLKFLRSSRLNQAYWLDKWHISPYYITAHAVIALVEFDPIMARDAVEWILATQRPDGAWGWYGSTCEETAYCIQALVAYHRRVAKLKQTPINRARDFITRQPVPWYLPSMWIEKTLYTPAAIVESTILSALAMTESL